MAETSVEHGVLDRPLGHDVGSVAVKVGVGADVAVSYREYTLGDVVDAALFPQDPQERTERIGQLGEFLAREGTCLLDRLRIMGEPLAGSRTAEEFFATATSEERALLLDFEEFLDDHGIDPLTHWR